MNKLLKHFACTDGLVKGTALISNLITTASISILPGFGAAGLLISNTIQMLVSALLEIPTGFIADRYGWNRAVRISLVLKVFVTLAFLLAMCAAHAEKPYWIWFFIGTEAIIDSFAGGFLSGAYQSAYLRWYESRLVAKGISKSTAAPLFLTSFQYALRIRFLLPLVVMGIVVTLHFFLHTQRGITPYQVAFISIGFVMILRLIVLARVNNDLTTSIGETHHTGIKLPFPDLDLVRKLIHTPFFEAYSISVAINMFSIFFLMGQIYKMLSTMNISPNSVWLTGTIAGIGIYFTRAVLGVIIFPRLASLTSLTCVKRLLLLLACFLLLGAAVLYFKFSLLVHFVTLLLLGIGSAFLSDAIQTKVESQLDSIVETSYRATWLSLGTAAGMLLFGGLSFLLLKVHLFHFEVGLFCGAFFLCCIISATRLPNSQPKKVLLSPSFATVMRRVFGKTTALLMLLFAALDIFTFALTTIRIEKANEQTVGNLILKSVEEPLIQGSFIEASRRLKRAMDEGSFLCGKLSAWEFSTDLCHNQQIQRHNYEIVQHQILLSGSSEIAIGSVDLYFDRTHIFIAIVTRVILSLLFFTLCALGLTYFLHKLGSTIQRELEKVLCLVDGREQSSSIRIEGVAIQEFQIIGDKLKEMLRLKTEISRQRAMTELAAQVSHDIRSPLHALSMITFGLETFTETNRRIVQMAVKQIGQIADGLLEERRNHNRIESPLAALISASISEKSLEWQNTKPVTLNWAIPKGSLGCTVKLNRIEFKRVISNLLNNAYEAISDFGTIELSLESTSDKATIHFKDSGKGISDAVLEKILSLGGSYGKEGGSGLGLSHAIEWMRKNNGALKIFSKEGAGTDITLEFQRVSTPSWLNEKIQIFRGTEVVIIDDDKRIYERWKERLAAISEISLRYLKNPFEIESYFNGDTFNGRKLFFCDQHIHVEMKGLDLIRKHGIESESVLVTGDWESVTESFGFESSNIRIMPKEYIELIGIHLV